MAYKITIRLVFLFTVFTFLPTSIFSKTRFRELDYKQQFILVYKFLNSFEKIRNSLEINGLVLFDTSEENIYTEVKTFHKEITKVEYTINGLRPQWELFEYQNNEFLKNKIINKKISIILIITDQVLFANSIISYCNRHSILTVINHPELIRAAPSLLIVKFRGRPMYFSNLKTLSEMGFSVKAPFLKKSKRIH